VPPVLRGFGPIPRRRLPFPAILAASSDDPFLAPARAQALATDWGPASWTWDPAGT
jgi:predicted alpha/beta hydrolase family esterase